MVDNESGHQTDKRCVEMVTLNKRTVVYAVRKGRELCASVIVVKVSKRLSAGRREKGENTLIDILRHSVAYCEKSTNMPIIFIMLF